MQRILNLSAVAGFGIVYEIVLCIQDKASGLELHKQKRLLCIIVGQ